MQAAIQYVLRSGQKIPLHQWTKLATDIFYFEGASYLLIVDYTSRFSVVCKLSSMTGQHVACQCKLIFSEYGWPDTLVSDNGPCYTAETFTSMITEYGVNHITSSLHFLQSNGLAEKFVQIVKNLFYKAKEEGKDLFKSLMIYHNTPFTSGLQSPQSRSARSDLPMSNVARKLLGLDSELLRNKHKNEHLPLHDLHMGQDVIFQDATSKSFVNFTELVEDEVEKIIMSMPTKSCKLDVLPTKVLKEITQILASLAYKNYQPFINWRVVCRGMQSNHNLSTNQEARIGAYKQEL